MENKSKQRRVSILTIIGVLAIAVLAIAVSVFLVSGLKSGKMYSNVKKIVPYLYEITYSDYREDVNADTHKTMDAFGCSSVKNGNFYGRNFDYIFNDTPEFVVHMKASENRHASIGVGTHYGLRENLMEQGAYDKQLELVPNLMLDGINDAGVIASINVVPGKEDVGELTGTNPNGKDLDTAFVVRFILDNADSADEAVELLRTRNLYGTAVHDMYLHIMIADATKTYVVEFINNEMVAMEKTGDEQIMTNFYVNLPELTEHSAGVERYEILKANYNEGTSLAGMRNLMKRVKYSNAYNYSTEPWYSEAVPQSVLKKYSEEGDYDEELFNEYMTIYDNIRKDYWNYTTNDLRNPANDTFWHTTHNSVYDIKNKVLRLTVQEDYSNFYDFSL